MTPADFPRFVVDGLEHRFCEHGILAASVTFRFRIFISKVVDAVRIDGTDIEKSRIRTERRGRPVRGAIAGRINETAVCFRILRWIRNWLPFFVEALRPVNLREGFGKQILSGDAVEHKEISVAS